jgi:hypothetical protein
MATSHPRIGVTKDPELAAALEATRSLLDPDEARSEAGQVRRLALVGARALVQDRNGARAALERQRILERSGVRPATRDLLDLPWLKRPGEGEPDLGDALDWVRGAR